MMISLTMTGKAMRRIPRNKEKQEEPLNGKRNRNERNGGQRA